MISFTLRTIVLAGLIFAATSLAQAQATRSWVSGVGDDANPCSRTAPCKTFQGAYSKTSSGGEIDCLDDGGFGAVTITNSITIDGTGHLASILVGSGTAITITGSNTVRLRGLSLTGITGLGVTGISIASSGKVFVEDCIIDGFQSNGITVTGSASLSVSNTTIRNIMTNGITFSPTAKTLGTIINSRIMSNGGSGISVQTSQIAITNCLIYGNTVGISTSNGGTAVISGNTISGNTTGLSPSARSFIISYGNNATYGNTNQNNPTSTQALQ